MSKRSLGGTTVVKFFFSQTLNAEAMSTKPEKETSTSVRTKTEQEQHHEKSTDSSDRGRNVKQSSVDQSFPNLSSITKAKQ